MENHYCLRCGQLMVYGLAAGEDRDRYHCESCGHIHYENPRIIVGCIAQWENKVLLCKRNTEPQKGKWTIPGGFMECEETPAEGAQRETLEETCADVAINHLHTVYSVASIHQVFMIYTASMENSHIATTPESSEVGLFAHSDIPWDELAFSSITFALKRFIAEPNSRQVHCNNGRIT